MNDFEALFLVAAMVVGLALVWWLDSSKGQEVAELKRQLSGLKRQDVATGQARSPSPNPTRRRAAPVGAVLLVSGAGTAEVNGYYTEDGASPLPRGCVTGRH